MRITDAQIRAFREALAARGLGEGTQRLYVVLVAACARDPRGIMARLTEGDLAPKSLRTNKAALKAWARFAQDKDLLMRLEDLRLPPAERARPKIPFEVKQWKILIDRIRTAKHLEPAMRATLFLIAVRGLRASDALRIKRGDVMTAQRTGKLSFEAKGRRRIEYDAKPLKEAIAELAAIKGNWERVYDLIVTRKCASEGSKRNAAAYKRVDRTLHELAKGLKIRDVSAHRFRRTYATEFLKALGGDPNAVTKLQKHVGWRSPQTAMGYVDAVNREELDKVGDDLTRGLLE